MEIIKIASLALVATVLIVLLREDNPEIALQMTVIVGILIFLFMIDKIVLVFNTLQNLSQKANIDNLYITTILKIIGISYIAEFGSQVCKDAGSLSIASKVEFAAKIIIMVLALPILMSVVNLIITILP